MGKLSKSVLRQILASDMVESVCDGVEKVLWMSKDKDSAKASSIISRARRHKKSWFRQAVGGDSLELEPGDYKRYRRAINDLRYEIQGEYGPEADAMEYINAAMLFVEDVVSGIPSSPADRKIAANDTLAALAALYDLYDQEGVEYAKMRAGSDFGERMKRASRCWS